MFPVIVWNDNIYINVSRLFAFIRETNAFIREANALYRVSNAFIRKCWAVYRESNAFICKNFAFISDFFYLRKWAFVSTITYPLYNFIIVFIHVSQTRVLNWSTYKSQHFLSSFVNIFDLDKTQFIIDKKACYYTIIKLLELKCFELSII